MCGCRMLSSPSTTAMCVGAVCRLLHSAASSPDGDLTRSPSIGGTIHAFRFLARTCGPAESTWRPADQEEGLQFGSRPSASARRFVGATPSQNNTLRTSWSASERAALRSASLPHPATLRPSGPGRLNGVPVQCRLRPILLRPPIRPLDVAPPIQARLVGCNRGPDYVPTILYWCLATSR